MYRMQGEEHTAPDGTKLELKPSKVGSIVADKIATRVVLLVLLLIIVLPLVSYSPQPNQEEVSLDLFEAHMCSQYGSSDCAASITLEDMVSYVEWFNDCDYDRCYRDEELVYLKNKANNVEIDTLGDNEDTYDEFRSSEFRDISTTTFEATFQIKSKKVEESAYSLCFILVAVIIFAVGAGIFLEDVQNYVIEPLEKLTALCTNLGQTLKFLSSEVDSSEQEMTALGTAIQKMAGLLKVGFGDAGLSVIEQNIDNADNDELNPMVPGVKVDVVIGFILLKNFGLLTDCLGTNIMVYANYVGEVVHRKVTKYGGNANKNMGGAILCVWKGDNAAANALLAFEEAIAEVDSDPNVRKTIEGSKELLDRAPGFKCELSSGIHTGWAIEGAVGSSMKIDATYLSPNVNMAARMMTASLQFGVPVLMTEVLFQDLPTSLQERMRCLDRIFVKGSKQPMRVYSPSDGDEEYTEKYCSTIELYVNGEWESAKTNLLEANEEFPADAAPQQVLEYMSRFDYNCPSDWLGARSLDKK